MSKMSNIILYVLSTYTRILTCAPFLLVKKYDLLPRLFTIKFLWAHLQFKRMLPVIMATSQGIRGGELDCDPY